MRKFVSMILFIFVLVDALPLQAQFGDADISRLRPVTKEFFEYIAKDSAGFNKNIPLIRTYGQYSWYRRDWGLHTWSTVEYIYIWNSPEGPRVRFMTGQPPVLEGCRLGLDYAYNVDDTIPTTDPCYFTKLPDWVDRPALDLEDLLQEHSQLRAVWLRLLAKHGHTEANKKFGKELEALGFERSGLPYIYDAYGGYTMDWDNLNGPAVVKLRPGVSMPQPEPVPMEFRWTDDGERFPNIMIAVSIAIVLVVALVFIKERLRIKVYA